MPWETLYKIAKPIWPLQQTNKLFSCLRDFVEGCDLLQISIKRQFLYHVFMNVSGSGQFQAGDGACSKWNVPNTNALMLPSSKLRVRQFSILFGEQSRWNIVQNISDSTFIKLMQKLYSVLYCISGLIQVILLCGICCHVLFLRGKNYHRKDGMWNKRLQFSD